MNDFREVYLKDSDEWPDHLVCVHCEQSVERGILNISRHWMNCLERKDGLIETKDPALMKTLDELSMNVNPAKKNIK
jgi:hypothetical protein